MNVAEDWFSEVEYSYAAMSLEKNCPDPALCSSIPLRQFFAENPDKAPLAARAKGLIDFRKNTRFCSRCGGVLHDDSKFTARKCLLCDSVFFPRIEPAVIILVFKGKKILLARHKNRIDKIYSCIAGFIEIGETAEHAVTREIFEETGLKVKNIQYVKSQGWPFPDQLMLAFTAEYESGTIKIQEDELLDADWFSKENLPPIPSPGSVAHNLITGIFESKSI